MTSLETDPDVLRTEAIRGFIGIIGGAEGFFAKGFSFSDLNRIRDADLSDPSIRHSIEDLAFFASRLVPTRLIVERNRSEPLIAPEIARRWLVKTERATETENGLVLSEEDSTVHVSLAGLTIAQSTEPGYLSDAYAAATDAACPLPDEFITGMAIEMVKTYSQDDLQV